LAVISGLIAGYQSALRIVSALIVSVVTYFSQAFRNEKVFHVLRDFCAEIAVLVAVFPILETLIGSRGAQEATQSGQAAHQVAIQHVWSVAIVSGGVAFVFLLLAIIIANRWG